jgi:hypothetical protein
MLCLKIEPSEKYGSDFILFKDFMTLLHFSHTSRHHRDDYVGQTGC